MRAVVQRVQNAKVDIDGKTAGEIGAGLLVFIAVGLDDNDDDIEWIVEKITDLRIFEDENDKMNLSVKDVGGEILVISQFTLYGDVRKGRRPSFIKSMPPEKAEVIYDKFVEKCRGTGLNIKTGVFKAHMDVHLINDGPVTLIIDTEDRKISRRSKS